MKRIKVLIFWVFLVATALTGWKVIFPKKNKLPEKLFVKTKKETTESLEQTLDYKDIKDIDAQELNGRYEFNIVIDLSLSVAPAGQRRAENRDNFYVELIRQIRDNYLIPGFRVKAYFFGTETVEIQTEDIIDFSLEKLKYYKEYRSENSPDKLQNYTDILGAFEVGLRELEYGKDPEKESFLIMITDDIHDLPGPGKTTPDPERQQQLKRELDQLIHTTCILYKYEGGPSAGSVLNYLTDHFAGVFHEEKVSFRDIAGRLVTNLKYDLYFYDLTTLRSGRNLVDKDTVHLSVENNRKYKIQEHTLVSSNFRAELLGKSTDRKKTVPVRLYPREEMTYLTFRFVNESRLFPMRVTLTDIDLFDEEITIEPEELESWYLSEFILQPGDEELWVMPVKATYKNSFGKSFFPFRADRALPYLQLSYQLEYQVNDKELHHYLRQELASVGGYSLDGEKILYQGQQITFLTRNQKSGKEALILQAFSPTFVTLLVWVILTVCMYVFLFRIFLCRPTLTGWNIIRQGEVLPTRGRQMVSVEGDYNDVDGDVIITAEKYRVHLLPFLRQPKDTIVVDFRYGAEVWYDDNEEEEYVEGTVRFYSYNTCRAEIFENIDLRIE